MGQPPVPEANTLVLANKVCWLSLPGYSHRLGLSGGGHYFGLDSQGHDFSRVCKVKCKKFPVCFTCTMTFPCRIKVIVARLLW